MKQLLTVLTLGNAALFLFGAIQHAGVPIGPFSEPVIIPATIVELLCALALTWGAVALMRGSLHAWRAALLGNAIAIAGVAIGMVALAAGAGPRTASNDFYHRIMVTLAVGSLVALLVPAGRVAMKRR
jgi:hypothetical protein